MSESCIFCKIAAGELPSNTVYEDTKFRAILDIAPAVKGHTILLVKQHTPNLFEAEQELLSIALPVIQKIAKGMQEALGCDGINLLQNNGEAAGQSVFHLHFHIIPRYSEDHLTIPWTPGSYADGEAEVLAKTIGSHIR